MTRLLAPFLTLSALLVAALCVAPPPAQADGEDQPPAPDALVHVPIDEIDVLLESGNKGVVLRYDEYKALVAAAHARRMALEAEPPVDAALTHAEGRIDCRTDGAARLDFTHVVRVLGDGPRSVEFPLSGFAIENISVSGPARAGQARYEEWRRRPRLRFDGVGEYRASWRGSAKWNQKGDVRLLDLRLPPAAAMTVELLVRAGFEGSAQGAGPALPIRAERIDRVVRVRPGHDGRLRIALAPAAKGEVGPPILDVTAHDVHTLSRDLIQSQVVVKTDVYRTPTASLSLQVPADLRLHDLSGGGVTGFRRSADRERILVDLEKPVLGRIELKLVGERGFSETSDLALMQVSVEGAVRQRRIVVLDPGTDVRLRDVRVSGGRRLALGQFGGRPGMYAWQLSGGGAGLRLDLESTEATLEAVSTWYWNLAEAGKTLVSTTTYAVKEGTVFTLRPRFPAEYVVRALTINGKSDGFRRDRRSDGTLEIHLGQGVKRGRTVALVATLEAADSDWLPDGEDVRVSLIVPSAGAARQEGLLAVGADAAFSVREAGLTDLAPVSAGELTDRGLEAAGLLYGYRVEGDAPALGFDVRRHESQLEAEVVTVLRPTPRRLECGAMVLHRIDRAGVRSLFVDVPVWAGDDVRFDTPLLRAANPLDFEVPPADLADGYQRWEVELLQRVIGNHRIAVRFHLDRDETDWKLDAERAVAVRVPLPRATRTLVVQRAQGLEVGIESPGGEGRELDVSELPRGARVDPLRVLGVVRLTGERNGLGLRVHRHDGAAVLDAIATNVFLQTAVATEGMLRTRARVLLSNAQRQFLDVRLPDGSELIGAVVDGKPVKPLTRADGTVLIPLPTARAASARTVADLTYETRLGEAVSGSVEIPGPEFPGLEILHTVHVAAVESDLAIRAVDGDLVGRELVQAPARRPWFSRLFDRVATADKSAADSGAPGPADSGESAALARSYGGTLVEQTRRLERAEAHPNADRWKQQYPDEVARLQAELADTLDEERAKRRAAIDDLSLEAYSSRYGSERDEAPAPPAGVPPPPMDMPAPAAAPEPAMPVLPAPPTPEPTPDASIRPEAGALRPPPQPQPQRPGQPGADPRDDRGGGKKHAENGRRADGEGGASPFAPQTKRSMRAGSRRKGLLSLMVPVWLAPNRVSAQRLGSGGTLELTLESREGPARRHLLFTLILLAVGLFVMRRRDLWRWFFPAALLLMAWPAAQWDLGGRGVLSSSLVDAALALIVVMGLRGIAGWWRARRLAVPAAKAVAVLALVLHALLSAPAHADEPRPKTPDDSEPDPLYVPYDPADPSALEDEDRVYLPLAAWLRLFRAAHPDQDPDVVRLGRIVTLTEARYDLRVAGEMAEGTLRFGLLQRGKGTRLVRLGIGGFAITKATLDKQPVRLVLDRGTYLLALTGEGEHTLELEGRVPLVERPNERMLAFQVPPFAAAQVRMAAGRFKGTLETNGAGRVVARSGPGSVRGFSATAYPGRVGKLVLRLVEPRPESLPETVVTRADTTTIHSLRDEGSEARHDVRVHVLQGAAPFVDFDLPAGARLLEARGNGVVRWERRTGADNRVRLFFDKPAKGGVEILLRTFRSADSADRTEPVSVAALVGSSGGTGRLIVNAHPEARVEVVSDAGWIRMARPRTKEAAGPDGVGRVVGAWSHATTPAPLTLGLGRAMPRLRARSVAAVTFGGDRVRSRFDCLVRVERTPVGTLVFDLPGRDEVRSVQSPGLVDWWLAGEGDERALHLRYQDLRVGEFALRVQLERRLGGTRDGILVPRWALRGAQHDEGRLLLYALPDVEPAAGATPGLRAVPWSRARAPQAPEGRARPVQAFLWERPLADALPVVLRTPDLELRATVMTMVAPTDAEHTLEHLVLFHAVRGTADVVRFFLPDGGFENATVVRTRDLREMRTERVTRRGPDGTDVSGTRYELRLQSPRSGLIEVTCSQVLGRGRHVRLPEPEDVDESRWFSLVRTFPDGQVAAAPSGGAPEEALWADVPFVPTGLQRSSVVRIHDSREPFQLRIEATRHTLEAQAEAVVLGADATVLVGRDGYARVKINYRVFNRARQFLRLKLPQDSVLFGASAAGRAIKPLQGAEGTVLLPIPKVPVGGAGYRVSILYRTRIGGSLDDGGQHEIKMPEVPGLDVDRTVVHLHVPEGYEYEFDGDLVETNAADVKAEYAAAALDEVRDLLKVAEAGTLDQRMRSAQNARALLSQAKQLAEYGDVANVRPDVQADAAELAQACAVICGKAESDWNEGQGQRTRINPSNIDFGGNAAQLIELQVDDQQLPGDAANAPTNKAGWRFNDAEAEKGEQMRGETAVLKKQIEQQFRSRAGETKNRRAAAQQQAKAALPQAKTPPSQYKALELELRNSVLGAGYDVGPDKVIITDETFGYDARNLELLNGLIRQTQQDNRQLGAFVLSTNPNDLGQTTTANWNNAPSAGAFFSDGPESDFRVRTESVFDSGLANNDEVSGFGLTNFGRTVFADRDGDTFFTDANQAHLLFAGDGARGQGASGTPEPVAASAGSGGGAGGFVPVRVRKGLMGVDVPLPEVGRVYHFRGRAARTIVLEAEPVSTPIFGRIAIVVLILGAAGLLGFAISRRRAAAASGDVPQEVAND